MPILTHEELLRDCLEAFEAVPVAAKARKLLIKWQQEAISGRAQDVLSAHMAAVIRGHLSMED